MQDKLNKDPEQLDTLHEFLNLQTEMMIMLLSMLEGSIVNGSIGRQMVDTLAGSSANVGVSDNSRRQLTLTFFDIFLRMKEIKNSDAFLVSSTQRHVLEVDSLVTLETTLVSSFLQKAFDVNKDGWISHREFQTTLGQQKSLKE
ncbi:Ryanodine receptor [Taenia solium]|eukprot:TsM_000970800 transcript=TsM_000970800 gene=TsM_000970800